MPTTSRPLPSKRIFGEIVGFRWSAPLCNVYLLEKETLLPIRDLMTLGFNVSYYECQVCYPEGLGNFRVANPLTLSCNFFNKRANHFPPLQHNYSQSQHNTRKLTITESEVDESDNPVGSLRVRALRP